MYLNYKGGDAEDHKKVGDKLRALKKGDEFIIEVTKNSPTRSLDQNRYYRIVLKAISIECGEDENKLHEMFKLKFNSTEIEFPNGLKEQSVNSTKDLRKDEFSIYIGKVKNWAKVFLNVTIPDRADKDYTKWMSIEKEYDKRFRFNPAD